MHNWAKKIMECVKTKVDGMGIDNINGQDLEELKTWTCIAEKIAEYDYYYHITEAMEDSDAEYGKDYDENGLMRGYRGRSARTGRYVHRAYPMRDMDRMDGKMYYDDSMRGYVEGTMRPNEMPNEHRMGYEEGHDRGYNEGYNRGYNDGRMNSRSSRYDMAKRGYEESKMKNESESDKVKQKEKLQELMDTLHEELKPLAPSMDATEKQIVRNGAQKIVNNYT